MSKREQHVKQKFCGVRQHWPVVYTIWVIIGELSSHFLDTGICLRYSDYLRSLGTSSQSIAKNGRVGPEHLVDL